MEIKTKSVCPICRNLLDATLFEKNGDIWMSRACPIHGTANGLFFKNAPLFKELSRYHSTRLLTPEWDFDFNWQPYKELCTTLAVDVTLRCNLGCPDCFSNAGKLPLDPQKNEVISWLPKIAKNKAKPNISLVGGESLLNENIFEIIEKMIEAGFVPRLNSNGILLDDESILNRLKKAGLLWIILQFDGFSHEVSKQFRNVDLVDLKLKVMEKLGRHGFLIHLAVMVETGQNLAEIVEILRFAFKTPQIRRVSFYPRAIVGRTRLAAEKTYLFDVIKSIAQNSNGEITQEDIISFKRIWNIAYKLTKNPIFLNRRCQTPFMLTGQGNRLIPLNRLINPLYDLIKFTKILSSTFKLLAFDRGRAPQDVMPVNIEMFYDTELFDLTAARNCHHTYITPKGYIPFCIYNAFFRNQ